MTSEKKKKERKESVRYKENPFISDLIVPIGTKQVKLSRLGKDEDVLVNKITGEDRGTHVVTQRKVDKEQFVKLFVQNISIAFHLNGAGVKALNVLIHSMRGSKGIINGDLLTLDKYAMEDFNEAHKDNKNKIKMSKSTFDRGIIQLEKAGIIAKYIKPGIYFINPNFIFSGDRIAFTNVIERKKDEDEEQVEDQTKE